MCRSAVEEAKRKFLNYTLSNIPIKNPRPYRDTVTLSDNTDVEVHSSYGCVICRNEYEFLSNEAFVKRFSSLACPNRNVVYQSILLHMSPLIIDSQLGNRLKHLDRLTRYM